MPNKTVNYGLIKPLATEYYDVNIQNGNMDVIDREIKNINDISNKKISELDSKINDMKVSEFKTDVLLTNLTGCNGGFVNVDSVKGKTLVNLSKFSAPVFNSQNLNYYSQDINKNTKGRNVTVVNLNSMPVNIQIYENNTFKRASKVSATLLINLSANEEIVEITGSKSDGWNDANKAELLKVMVLDGEVKVAPNAYFEGIKHVGELVTLQAKSDTTVTSKQFIDLEVVNAYDMKIGELVKWVDANNTLVRDNIKITNIVGNVLSLDFGSVFETGTIKSIEKLIPKTDHYRIEFISKTENFINYKNYNLVSNMPTNVKFDGDKRWDWDTNGNYGGIVFNLRCPIGSTCTVSLKGDRSRIIVSESSSIVSSSSTSINGNMVSCSFVSKTGKVSIVVENAETGVGHSWFSELMCVLGSTPPSKFIPYVENKTEILSATPWSKYDYTDVYGVKHIFYKKRILNGTESWGRGYSQYGWKDDGNTVVFYTDKDVVDVSVSSIDNVITESFPFSERLVAIDTECVANVVWDNKGHIAIRIQKSKLPSVDVDGFKQWLSINNITITYKAITETLENTNKTLILDAYPNGNLQVNSGAVQAHVEGSYSTNMGERITGAEKTVDSLNTRASNLEKSMFVVAGNVVDINEKLQEFKRYKSGTPVDGKYPIFIVKRMDDTLYKVSTLSGGTAPLWTTRTIQQYDKTGTIIIKTTIKTLTYDADGIWLSEV